MNKDEKQYLSKVADLGCMICNRPAEIHHPRMCNGMSQRSPHWLAIPLCESHHRLNGYGHAIHNGQQEFEKNYLSEAELLSIVIRRLCK
jgi:hypothetical protein